MTEYPSTRARNLDRLRRVFNLVHPNNRDSLGVLRNAIKYELEREGLKFRSGKDAVSGVDFHVYDPFEADIMLGQSKPTNLHRSVLSGCTGLKVVVLRKLGPTLEWSEYDLVYQYLTET